MEEPCLESFTRMLHQPSPNISVVCDHSSYMQQYFSSMLCMSSAALHVTCLQLALYYLTKRTFGLHRGYVWQCALPEPPMHLCRLVKGILDIRENQSNQNHFCGVSRQGNPLSHNIRDVCGHEERTKRLPRALECGNSSMLNGESPHLPIIE